MDRRKLRAKEMTPTLSFSHLWRALSASDYNCLERRLTFTNHSGLREQLIAQFTHSDLPGEELASSSNE